MADYPPPMDDIYEIRRKNVARVLAMPAIARLKRKQDQAKALDLSASMFSQLIHPEYKVGDDMARKIEAQADLEPGWMDNPSQPVGMDIPKLSEALVSVDKAVREMGLQFNAAYVAEALYAAYLERLRYPDALDPQALSLYDRLVFQHIRGGVQEHEYRDRKTMGTGKEAVGNDAPVGKKTRGSGA